MNPPGFTPRHLIELPSPPVDKPLDAGILQMGMNENPYGPSPLAIAAAQAAMHDCNRYPDDTGYRLRQKLASRFGLSVDEVIVGVGASDLLGIAFYAVLEGQAEALTSQGSFVVYYLLAGSTGMRMECVPLKDYRFDLPAIAERINTRTRLILIANPNNPTGTIIHRQEFEQFLAGVPDHVLLVMDEAYFEYVDSPEYPNSLDYIHSGKSILTLRTFSKVYGLAGMRLGYGFANREVIDTLYKVRMTYSVNGPSIAAGLAALDDQEHIEKSVRLNRVERDFVSNELRRRGLKCVSSSTNFVLIDFGIPAEPLAAALYREGFVVRPAWGIPTGLRVSLGLHEQNERFLAALEKVL